MSKDRSGYVVPKDHRVVLIEGGLVVSTIQGKTSEEAKQIVDAWVNGSYKLLTE